MAIVPLRDIGQLGVITDVDPFDLPPNAFSFAKNIRFENGKASRGNIFRSIGTLTTTPRHLIGYEDANGTEKSLFVDNLGSIREYPGETDRSPAAWTPLDSSANITSCILQNIVYVNRPDRLWCYRSKTGTGAFTQTPTGATTADWGSTFRCEALRSLNGVLIALNITKGSTRYPTMVKWSDFAEFDTLVPDWDYASTTSSAGENTLADMDGEILDGVPLRNRLYLYARTETRYMEYVGGNDMFRFDTTKTFDKGVISVNCVVENGNLHYVFGDDDIWVHDGVTQKSIADGRVRRFIFRSLDKTKSDRFFVTQDKKNNEIIFCYVSNDAYVRWSASSDGCNRAAVYNTASETWTFYDMPLVTCAGRLQPILGASWDASGATWSSIGGSWASSAGDSQYNLVFGNAATTGVSIGLRSFAPTDDPSAVGSLDDTVNVGSYAERGGIDLDMLKVSLRGYKLVNSIYPQGRMEADAAEITFTFGISDHPNESPFFGTPQTYSNDYYKLDFFQAGRFLTMKFEQTLDYRQFSFSGIDLDLSITGEF